MTATVTPATEPRAPAAPAPAGTRHHHACPLCEAMCGLVIEADGPRVTSIRGDPDDPFSRGHICPKAVALTDLHTDPDRIRRPMKRQGATWMEIGWDEALDLAASGLRAAQRAGGSDAVATFAGNPTVHSLGAMLYYPDFVRSLRTKNRYSATSVDQLPHHVAAATMFGHPLLIPIPDIDRTRHLLMFGANPHASNGSLMTAPDVVKRLKAIQQRGGKVVVVDPRRTETAQHADTHHFIAPGADAFLLLALLNVVFAESLARDSRAGALADGGEQLRALVAPWTPERVSPATGIAPETIRAIARDFARAETAACYGRVGVSMQEFGGLACWLITALNLVTGRVDEPGGVMFTKPAIDPVAGRGMYSSAKIGRWKSRVRGLPEFMGELPVATLADEIETPGPGQVRALVTHAGNPVLSTPNGARLERALAKLDFMVSIDFYLNETTRHAHLILPPVSQLERDHYDITFHALAVRNTARYSPPLFAPAKGAMPDWRILSALTERMQAGGGWAGFKARWRTRIMRRLSPRGLVDRALKAGPYGAKASGNGDGLTLVKLERAKSGVDLGALVPMLPARLKTANGRIALVPEAVVADLPRLEARLAAFAAPRNGTMSGTLSLIGRRELRSNNSWMHNSERLVRGRRMCTLYMHPSDASARGLADGARARVSSRVGEVECEVEVSETMMPGVVCLPHGWGHHRPGTGQSVARAHAGVSINDLTDEQRVDALCGTAGFSGTEVRVSAVTA